MMISYCQSVLYYRALRHVGTIQANAGWVVAVSQAMLQQVVVTYKQFNYYK